MLKAFDLLKGFEITFATHSNDAQCGADLTLDFGEISSPGYPTPLTHETECVWTITGNFENLIFCKKERRLVINL